MGAWKKSARFERRLQALYVNEVAGYRPKPVYQTDRSTP
jgi:hypothetical protein